MLKFRKQKAGSSTQNTESTGNMRVLNPSIRSRFLFSPCFSWVERCLQMQSTVSTVSAGHMKTVEIVSETKTERPATQLKQRVSEIRRAGRASQASVCLLL